MKEVWCLESHFWIIIGNTNASQRPTVSLWHQKYIYDFFWGGGRGCITKTLLKIFTDVRFSYNNSQRYLWPNHIVPFTILSLPMVFFYLLKTTSNTQWPSLIIIFLGGAGEIHISLTWHNISLVVEKPHHNKIWDLTFDFIRISCWLWQYC